MQLITDTEDVGYFVSTRTFFVSLGGCVLFAFLWLFNCHEEYPCLLFSLSF